MTNDRARLPAPHLFILPILLLAALGPSIAQAAEAVSTTTNTPTSSRDTEGSDTDLKALREAANREYSAGRYRKAAGMLEAVISTAKQAQAPALDVTRFQLLLARSYQYLGRLAEARRLLEDVIDVRERILGTLHADLAFPLHSLGANHRLTREYANARKLHDRALSITRNTQDEGFALGLLKLGMLADSEGYTATAERYYREVVQILANRGELNHLVMAAALRALGVLLSNPFEATEARYREAAVARGDGVAGCSQFTVAAELRAGFLSIVRLRGWKVRRTISIVRHREAVLTPSAREFVAMVHARWHRRSLQLHREGSSLRR
jgi:tetratricopeptide (TPR) repeat protein